MHDPEVAAVLPEVLTVDPLELFDFMLRQSLRPADQRRGFSTSFDV